MAEVNLDYLEGLRQEAERGYKVIRYQRAVRNAAPALLAEVRQLRDDNQRLRGLLQQVQRRVADTEGGLAAGVRHGKGTPLVQHSWLGKADVSAPRP